MGARRSTWAMAAAMAGVLAFAAACGFRPLYGEGTGGSPEALAQVRVAAIADREGQMLRNYLLDGFNPRGIAESAAYELRVMLQESRHDIAFRGDATATRANLTLNADYQLVRLADQTSVVRSQTLSTVSYNVLNNDFATLSSQADARRRAVREIGDEIRRRVALELSAPAPGAAR
jgi:LPS-assembly lipoprotein